VEGVKKESGRKREELHVLVDMDLCVKTSRKASLVSNIRQAHARNLSLDSENRSRVKSEFQSKKGMELLAKAEMEAKIKELEALEQRIVDNLKRTFATHEEEIARLEGLIVRQKSPRLSSSVGFTGQNAFVTEEESRGATD
jgi:wobble nucleotide-excising tRNase